MGLVSSLLWQTESGRGLIRVNEGAKYGGVLVADCTAAELRELSKAAIEAAEQIEAFAADAAEVRKLIVEMLKAGTLRLDMSQRLAVRKPAVGDLELQQLIERATLSSTNG